MKKRVSRNNHALKRYYLRHFMPVTVWLMAVACVVWLFHQQTQRFEIVGLAQSEVYEVAATCAGRLKEVPVKLFDEVTQGQKVAVLDTVPENEQVEGQLNAQLAVAMGEIERLLAQLVPTQDTMLAAKTDREAGRIADMRRFYVDVESARLRILGLKATIASDRITLNDLQQEVTVVQLLLEQEVATQYELERARAQHASLAKKVEESERLLEQGQRDLELAQQRLEEFTSHELEYPSIDGQLDVTRKEIALQERLIKEIQTQLSLLKTRRALELKAPIDGVVVQIPESEGQMPSGNVEERVFRRPGEVVKAGDPILAVAKRESAEVVAYVSEQMTGAIRKAMAVDLIKSADPPQIAKTRVTYVGPAVELMPKRLWRNPTIPQWGRPILIEVPRDLKVVPGELVGVRRQ